MKSLKSPWLILLLAALCISACETQSKDTTAQYLVKSRADSYEAADKSDIKVIQNAINMYQTANGTFPPTIQDVGKLMSSQLEYDRYDYNPQTGIITVKSNR